MNSPKITHLKLAIVITFHCLVAQADPGSNLNQAQKKFKTPDDLTIQLVASEPNIRQPLSISFDARGRMWVLQYLQYPLPAGLKPVSMDRYLRTQYDRLPKPPPDGPKGADRIAIFEDKDGDGKMELVGNFLDDLNLASGFAIGYGGIFVAQPPYLLFYADKNHDDKPDGDPKVLLTGFGMEDSHAFANSLTWGPDGWLYGVQGSTVTAKINGIEFQQGVWRYHPRKHDFELFAEGGGNTWGLDFDRMGNLFSAGNTVEPLCHHVQGAYHVKGFGKHGPLHNPHSYGYFQPVKHYGYTGDSLTGGFVLYQGGAFPNRFNDACLAPNGRHSAMRWSTLELRGSTFSTRAVGDLITTEDISFRPVDSTVGPDGALYVADWYDHHLGHAAPEDHSKYYKPQRDDGRIWRLASPDLKPIKQGMLDFHTLSSRELLDLAVKSASQPDGNIWYTRQARLLLAERRDKSLVPRCQELALKSENQVIALEGLWGLIACDAFDEEFAGKALQSPHEYVRAWAIRIAGDSGKATQPFVDDLVRLAKRDPSVVVRSQLASTAKRLSAESGIAIVRGLIRHPKAADDVQLPLLIWWAIEDKAMSNSDLVIKMATSEEWWSLPITQRFLAERLVRRFASEGEKDDYATCSKLFSLAPNGTAKENWITGMNQALAGRKLAAVPTALAKVLSTLLSETPENMDVLTLGVSLGSPSAAEKVVVLLSAEKELSEKDQLMAIALLGQSGRAEGIPILFERLMSKNTSAKIGAAVLSSLSSFQGKAIAGQVLNLYSQLDEATAAQIIEMLVSRRDWSDVLLSRVEQEKIATNKISVDQLRRMLSHEDKDIANRIEKKFGSVRATDRAEVKQQISALKKVIESGKGSQVKGREIFTARCAACHRLFGKGTSIGPDLTGAERKNLEILLTNIVDPSAVIRQQFIYHLVKTKDSRVLTGLLANLSPDTVTLLDAANQRTLIERKNINKLEPIPVSLMPEGLIAGLSDSEVRDLFAYLQGEKIE